MFEVVANFRGIRVKMSRSRIVVVTFLCDRQSDYGCLAVGKPGEEGLR